MTEPLRFHLQVAPNRTQVRVASPRAAVQTNPVSRVILAVTPGPTGAAGPAGTGFTYTQVSPAATWTITNTLGRYPNSVGVYIDGELVDADVETPDTSTIVITFASPQSGRAEII